MTEAQARAALAAFDGLGGVAGSRHGMGQGSRMRTFKLSRPRAAKTGRRHQRSGDHAFFSYNALLGTG